MPRYAPQKLTEGFVKNLPQDGTTYVVRDSRVIGLLISVNKASKSYKVQRDLWRGVRGHRQLIKTVRHTLGTTDELTLEEARLKAEDVIRQIKLGIDPNNPLAHPVRQSWTVDSLFEEYAADLRKRERSERSIKDVLYTRDLYLVDWRSLPLRDLTRSMVRARHEELSRTRGKVTANNVMRDLRAAYNLALRIIDDPDMIPDNPVKSVTFNKERRRNAVIMPDDLPHWWERVQRLSSPLRRAMHEFGLFSGLRPGTLVSLRREWVRLEQRAISIPKMKSGRSFDLPLSRHMVGVLRRAIDVGEALFPGAIWLFPTRALKDDIAQGIRKGDIIPTQVWREKSLPSDTGHLLRHTYRTVAQRVGIDKVEARLLMDHAVPGIDGVYIHERALFDKLLAAQERISTELLLLCSASAFGPKHT